MGPDIGRAARIAADADVPTARHELPAQLNGRTCRLRHVTRLRTHRRALVGWVVLGVSLCGCGLTDSPAQHYAKLACTAYQETGRAPIATTKEQTSAILDLARSNARAAAAFDPRWATLSSDIHTALDLRQDEADRFFEVDRRVQDDCNDAGRDIGDLKP
jgi:hypothetical protein